MRIPEKALHFTADFLLLYPKYETAVIQIKAWGTGGGGEVGAIAFQKWPKLGASSVRLKNFTGAPRRLFPVKILKFRYLKSTFLTGIAKSCRKMSTALINACRVMRYIFFVAVVSDFRGEKK